MSSLTCCYSALILLPVINLSRKIGSETSFFCTTWKVLPFDAAFRLFWRFFAAHAQFRPYYYFRLKSDVIFEFSAPVFEHSSHNNTTPVHTVCQSYNTSSPMNRHRTKCRHGNDDQWQRYNSLSLKQCVCVRARDRLCISRGLCLRVPSLLYVNPYNEVTTSP